MKSKPRNTKKAAAEERRYDVEGLALMLQDWEEHRRVRDMGGGNRQMSEKILAQITGKWTEFENVHGLLNAYEERAEQTFQEWRKSLSFELMEQPAPPDRSKEIFALYELLRVVLKCGDKDLQAAWFAERTWAETILIPLMLQQKPNHNITTY